MQAHSPLFPFIASFDVHPVNAGIALALSVGVYLAIHGLLAVLRKRATNAQAPRPAWREIVTASFAATSNLAIALTALCVGLSVLTLPAPWDSRVEHLWILGLGAQVGLYLHRALALAAAHYFHHHARRGQEQLTVAHTLVVWGLQCALWITLVLGMLANLGINISTFIASLGIGGVAIALAVQNILGDLFASLSIAIDKPFEVGDAISVASVSGTVEQVGLKTTRIRSDSGEQIVMSNAELLKSTVRNFKRMSRRRVQFALRVNPSTPPELAAKIPLALAEIVQAQHQAQFERAHLKSVEQAWLEFDVVYYLLNPSYSLYMQTQQEVLLAMMGALDALGVATSAPAQSLAWDAAPGGAAAPAGDAAPRPRFTLAPQR